MPVLIKHPKKNKVIRHNSFVASGKCDDSALISGYLHPAAGGNDIHGTLVNAQSTKHWGLVFKAVGNGKYTLVVKQGTFTDSRGHIFAADMKQVDFSITGVVQTPAPDVVYPDENDEVLSLFYPYGTSGDSIVDPDGISFYDDTNYQQYGTLIQNIDANGFWYGYVDASLFTTPGDYNISVTNGRPTIHSNITITP